jgi:hypothetical protein
MISVENFYWILYENLLKPLEIDAWYYYPWGTQNYLSVHEFRSLYRKLHLNHVLFHHDQEPIWTDSLGKEYDERYEVVWSNSKFVKFFANSEKSDIKKQICDQRHMLDWYFFYHGFASLNWYRDSRYVHQDHDIHHAFVSFNHIIAHHRSYRISLLARLIYHDVIDRGQISWHNDLQKTLNEIENPFNFLSERSRSLCRDTLIRCKDLPWKLDDVSSSGNLSAYFGNKQYQIWQHSLLHVVNETVFYQPKLHLTEKIFKPIVAQRPFILVAAPGNLQYLKSYGFKTFDTWIDESYDDIQDPDQRLDLIAQEITRFSRMSLHQLRQVYQEMRSILEYNKAHFFGEFRHIIVNELVDNFDQCIRIWNNGRMDGRELPLSHDLEKVKKMLLC